MKEILEQKRGFNYRKHTLYPDKVLIEMKSMRKIDRYEIKIEKLGFDIQYQADNTLPGKIFLIICIVIPIILTIVEFIQHDIDTRSLIINYVIWFGLALFGFFKHHQDDIYLVGEKNLVFYRTIPSEQKVLNFIQLVINTAKDNIKSKYLLYDDSTIEEEYLSRLSWLKDTDIITEEEFNEYKIDFEIKRLL